MEHLYGLGLLTTLPVWRGRLTAGIFNLAANGVERQTSTLTSLFNISRFILATWRAQDFHLLTRVCRACL